MLLRDVHFAMSGECCPFCDATAEPGKQGCFIAGKWSYKNIWQKLLQGSYRVGETSGDGAQTLHSLFSYSVRLKVH